MKNFRELGRLETIARTTRADFEAGLFPEDEIISLAREYDVYGDWVTWRARESVLPPNFPYAYCPLTTLVLARRVGYGELIEGVYLPAGKDADKTHLVLGVGQTALGGDTILDITADQFEGPPVYVGPLVRPWSRERQYYSTSSSY